MSGLSLRLNGRVVAGTWQRSKLQELCSKGRKTAVLQSGRGGKERAPLGKLGWKSYEVLVQGRIFSQIVCPAWLAGVLVSPELPTLGTLLPGVAWVPNQKDSKESTGTGNMPSLQCFQI